MRKNDGFGLFELLVVMGVIALVTAIAMPQLLSSRADTRLRRAAADLRGAAQLTRSRAIQEGKNVILDIHRRPDNWYVMDSYSVYVDGGDGSGGPSNYERDPSEPLVHRQEPTAGVTIELIDTATGEPADFYFPQGTHAEEVLLWRAVTMHKDALESGVVGGLFSVENFQVKKIHFKKASFGEHRYLVFYDGNDLSTTINLPDLPPNWIVFDGKGRCLHPLTMVVVNVKGQKYAIEITPYGISKATKVDG